MPSHVVGSGGDGAGLGDGGLGLGDGGLGLGDGLEGGDGGLGDGLGDGGLGDGLGGGGGSVPFTMLTSAQFQNSSGTAPCSPHALKFPMSPGGRHELPVTHHHHKVH